MKIICQYDAPAQNYKKVDVAIAIAIYVAHSILTNYSIIQNSANETMIQYANPVQKMLSKYISFNIKLIILQLIETYLNNNCNYVCM